MLTSAVGVTPVVTGGVTLFVGFGSPVGDTTPATFVSVVPATGAVTVKVRFVACTIVNVPRFQVTVPPLVVPPPLAPTKVTPTGRASVTTTPTASEGPRFVTLMV